jgi:hypothetical protein
MFDFQAPVLDNILPRLRFRMDGHDITPHVHVFDRKGSEFVVTCPFMAQIQIRPSLCVHISAADIAISSVSHVTTNVLFHKHDGCF